MYCFISFYRASLNQTEEIDANVSEIAKKYADYPVLHWRVRFLEVLSQLEEINSGDDVVRAGAHATRQQKNVN